METPLETILIDSPINNPHDFGPIQWARGQLRAKTLHRRAPRDSGPTPMARVWLRGWSISACRVPIWICTEEFEFLDLVDSWGVAFSVETVMINSVSRSVYLSSCVKLNLYRILLDNSIPMCLVYECACMRVCVSVCVHIFIYVIRIRMCVYACGVYCVLFLGIRMCVYECVCQCRCIYICTRVHIHVHTYISWCMAHKSTHQTWVHTHAPNRRALHQL